jgi:hypothetical protein
MANTALTADVIASEALVILENELGFLDTIHRAYEDEFDKNVNGYKKGDTISIRRPADFTVRSGAVMDVQDAIEGKVALTIDKQIGVDMAFTSSDMTLKVSDFSERFIKPAMINIVNEMAAESLTAMLPEVYNYVGTPNTAVDSFDDFYRSQERMDLMSVPQEGRFALLNPTDHARLLANQTGLYIEKAEKAYTMGILGNLGGVKMLKTQVVPPQDYGTADNTTPLTDGNSQEVDYDDVKNTWKQELLTDGWDTTTTLKAGQVFTIDGVYMVNPKTKRSTGVLQNFTVMEDVTTNANASNNTDFDISPPIITSGPHQTVTYSGNFDGRAIVLNSPAVGAAAATYRQNVSYHKNAFALAIVPMEMPQGSVNGARKSYKGISVRVLPVYDGVNDISKWRFDLLYGRKCIDPRLAARFSGTS